MSKRRGGARKTRRANPGMRSSSPRKGVKNRFYLGGSMF